MKLGILPKFQTAYQSFNKTLIKDISTEMKEVDCLREEAMKYVKNRCRKLSMSEVCF